MRLTEEQEVAAVDERLHVTCHEVVDLADEVALNAVRLCGGLCQLRDRDIVLRPTLIMM